MESEEEMNKLRRYKKVTKKLKKEKGDLRGLVL